MAARLDRALDQRQVQAFVDKILVSIQAELTILGLQLALGNALDTLFVGDAVVDQVGDSTDF